MPLTTPRLISLRPTSRHAVSRVHQCTNIHASVQFSSSRGQELRSSDNDNTEERDGYIERICGAIGADEIGEENEITVSGEYSSFGLLCFLLDVGSGDVMLSYNLCRQADIAGDGGQLGVEVAEWRWPFLGALRWGGDDDRVGVQWGDGAAVGCRCCRALLRSGTG
jgi:hypothetical protein